MRVSPARVDSAAESAWDQFPRRWARLTPPLRPDADVCAAVRGLIAEYDGANLALGVTPEFSDLTARTVATDCSARMLDTVWPGNTPRRCAVRANWLSLPFEDMAFSTVIGDGSLSCLRYPFEYRRFFIELSRALQPGGRIVIRAFLRPETGESPATVRDRTQSGRVRSVHTLKWLLAHAVCAERGHANIDVRQIHRTFCRLFPDRAALKRATGWNDDDVNVIDFFERLPDAFSFPTAAELLEVVPDVFSNVRFVAAGAYEIAERCPLLVAELER